MQEVGEFSKKKEGKAHADLRNSEKSSTFAQKMSETIVIFDLGGVLINLNVNRCMRAFEALMGEQNMRSVMGMDINGEGVKAVSIATKQLMMDFEHGLISTDAFVDQVLRFCHPGTTAQQVVDAWMSMLEELPKERLDIVDRVRQNVRNVYLLSNGNDLHFDFINQTYQLAPHFDALFLSQKMHMAKPEPEIYRAVNEQISSDISEKTNVLFIDDIAANREAAEKTVGWTTFPNIESVVSYLNL